MRPTWHLQSLADVTPAFLEQHNIRGIIWDVDGTLTAFHGAQLHLDIEPAFRALLALPQARHVLVSNSPEVRFAQLGVILPSVPVLRVYALDATTHPRTLFGGADSMSAVQYETLMRSGARALRKPDDMLAGHAVAVLGCSALETVMVGDQYLTDVAGAGMAGIRSIKLPTLAEASFPLAVRAAQLVERLLFLALYAWRPAPTLPRNPRV